MAMIQSGSNSAGYANVDANYNAQVNLPGNTSAGVSQGGGTANAGFATMLSEVDSGSVTGSRLVREPEVSQDYRQRVGMDTLLFSDTFNASAQNTANWSYTFNTMTAAQPGTGTVNFSTVQGTTSAHGAFMRTFQTFPLFGTFPLSMEFHAGQFTAALTTNEVWLMGAGLPTGATTPPTDGVWIQITSAGVIGVMSFAGVSTPTGTLIPLGSLTVGDLDKFIIVVGERVVEFWRDNTLLGTLNVPNANGQPFQTTSLPMFMMKYNTGNVTNTNNSYGAISDVKTKQDIVDAASQWDDLKGLKVRKFRYKNDPTAPLQIGLVAQEAETVSPGLIDEHPDYEEVEVTDEEGNVKTERQLTGTSTKSIKYSVLYMKAIKALQEAMTRIETLEAKVAALEGTQP